MCNGSREKTAFAHLFRDTSKENQNGTIMGTVVGRRAAMGFA